MGKNHVKKRPSGAREPRRVRLPGVSREQEIGLGDALKRVTSALGIAPCGGCEQRAATLNSWVVITGAATKRKTV